MANERSEDASLAIQRMIKPGAMESICPDTCSEIVCPLHGYNHAGDYTHVLAARTDKDEDGRQQARILFHAECGCYFELKIRNRKGYSFFDFEWVALDKHKLAIEIFEAKTKPA